MLDDLERLVELQRVENLLRAEDARLQEVPKRRAALDGELLAERRRLDDAREGLASSQKNRRALEAALQDLETKRSRYKSQLMEVKTNKEYTAMLHEIEGVERDIRGKEDLVLQDMEQVETLQAAVKTEEREFKAVETRHGASVKELDTEAAALEVAVAKLRAERDAVLARLTTETRELYERVARKRGSGVAEARDSMCQQCHIKLRPQMYVDLKRRDQIIQCPGCQRILFYEPPAPEVDPPTA